MEIIYDIIVFCYNKHIAHIIHCTFSSLIDLEA